jgi:TRAP transporter TAXI family solute receptor
MTRRTVVLLVLVVSVAAVAQAQSVAPSGDASSATAAASAETAADIHARLPILLVGGGSVVGAAFAASGAVARVVEDHAVDLGFRIAVQSTGGSMENLVRLGTGELDMGVAGSDWVYDAQLGFGPFEEAPKRDDLRTLFALYAEPLTVLVRRDVAAASVADLAGLRINLGPPGTHGRLLFERLLDAFGVADDGLADSRELDLGEQGAALCRGDIDAAAYLSGHPSGTIAALLAECPVAILPITGDAVWPVLTESPYLSTVEIPAGLYQGVDAPVPTVGPVMSLVTTVRLSDERAYAIVRAVFEHLEALRIQLPLFATLDPGMMVSEGTAAPLHAGALRYFTEAGLR